MNTFSIRRPTGEYEGRAGGLTVQRSLLLSEGYLATTPGRDLAPRHRRRSGGIGPARLYFPMARFTWLTDQDDLDEHIPPHDGLIR